jgi:predicted GTPase
LNIHNIGINYSINFDNDNITYTHLKFTKSAPINQQNLNNLFVDTYQTKLIKANLSFLFSNHKSQIIIYGEPQSGKSTLINSYILSEIKENKNVFYKFSLYSIIDIEELNLSLRKNY